MVGHPGWAAALGSSSGPSKPSPRWAVEQAGPGAAVAGAGTEQHQRGNQQVFQNVAVNDAANRGSGFPARLLQLPVNSCFGNA